MAAARKLQSEIEKTLKKVQEGVDVFDDLWEKLHESENQNQKDKFESEMKKEIKRLQRYRDQIKTWIASNEVKDKRGLLEARKAVEREMERFKICEKETKTKAFSREGLAAKKLDPKNKARQEIRDWLNNVVDKLNLQIDEAESELEAAISSKKKQKDGRVAQYEVIVSRHKEHIKKLEHLLRLLDNEQLEPEDIVDLKDFLDDYLERNQDDPDDFEDTEYFYDAVAEKLDVSITDIPFKKEDKKSKSFSEQDSLDSFEIDKGKAEPQSESQMNPAVNNTSTQIKVAVPPVKVEGNFAGVKEDSQIGQASHTPKLSEHTSIQPEIQNRLSPNAQSENREASSTFPSNNNVPPLASSMNWNYGSGLPMHKEVKTFQQVGLENQNESKDRKLDGSEELRAQMNNQLSSDSRYSEFQAGGMASHRDMNSIQERNGPPVAGGPPSYGGYQQDPAFQAMRFSETQGSDKRPVLDSTQDGGVVPFPHSIHSIPQDQDRKWGSKSSQSKGLNIPDCYPKVQPQALHDPSIYERSDDTLFFAFYYQPGIYNQYLAARALKKKNWRFNKKHNAWFQRLKEPTYVTSENETGSYLWFDHLMYHEDGSQGWRRRVRENFLFQYADLENEVK